MRISARILDRVAESVESFLDIRTPVFFVKIITESRPFIGVFEFFAGRGNNLSVFVTHRYIDPDLIDEVIVLDKGRIVQKGTPKELSLCKGFYSDMLKTYKCM